MTPNEETFGCFFYENCLKISHSLSLKPSKSTKHLLSPKKFKIKNFSTAQTENFVHFGYVSIVNFRLFSVEQRLFS